MSNYELHKELETINRALKNPQHYGPYQLRAFRKRKSYLNKQLQQCQPPATAQLTLKLR